MKIFTKSLIWTVCCLSIFSTPLLSSNITILESQSVHPLHKMDVNWKNLATSLGHTATIVDQAFLDDYANLSSTDILITSSGLIDISESRKLTILQFVQNGGNVYIQSEYLINLAGNATFEYITSTLGSTFEWQTEVPGNLNPMEITGSLASGLSDGDTTIDYFWYGASGAGDENFIPFLNYDNKDWGFIYCPNNITYGKIITTSDQDWIRTSNNNGLMKNILESLLINNSISALPTVSITDTNSPCDDTYSFTALIANNTSGITLEWLVNGQIVANENGLSFSSNSLIDGDVVECRIAMSNLCANYSHVSNPILIAPIFPVEVPELVVNVDNTSFCEGETFTFTASIIQPGDFTNLVYQWLINGVEVPNASNQVFLTDNLSNEDIVVCQLTYDALCETGLVVLSNDLEMNLLPMLDPIVFIAADATEICAGELVTFTASGTDLGDDPTYQWQINGVNVGPNAPSFSSADLLNTQNVNCLITIQNACSTINEANSNAISIIVNEIVHPSIEISTSTTTICSGEVVTVYATAFDFGFNPTFQWQIDGLNVGTNQPEFTTTELEDGQVISCILSVTEPCASSAVINSESISFSVTEGSVPTLSIVASTTSICSGGEITLSASGLNHGPNPSYEWVVNGVLVGDNTPNLTLSNVNLSQEISCTVINTEACPSNNSAVSNPVIINVSAILVEALELVAESCNNSDGLIEVMASGGSAPYTYEWSNGENTSVLSAVTAGDYTLIVTDINGCSEVVSYEVQHNAAPQISNIILDRDNCTNENNYAEIVIESGSSIAYIEWINEQGEVVSNNIQAYDLAPGIYEITVTNTEGCEVFETLNIEAVSPLSVVVENEVRLDLGNTVELEVIVASNQNVTYEWYPAEGLSCTDCATPTANPTSDIIYTVTVTNEFGCTSSERVIVRVIPNDEVFIPNAFSPNGDGVNDFFTVYGGQNVAAIKTLRVFDRWGAEVYGNQDFSPNDAPQGWNGSYKGKMMKSGVYIYYVEVEYIDGSTKIKKGDLSITL